MNARIHEPNHGHTGPSRQRRYARPALLVMLAWSAAVAQPTFHVQPKPNSDTMLVQLGVIPLAVDLKLVRFESASLLKQLGLKKLPAEYTYDSFVSDSSVHYVFAFPGARGLLDVYGCVDRGRPSFGFHITRTDGAQHIRNCAPLAVSKEGFMATITDSSVHICFPDGSILNDRHELPAFFFEKGSCPIITLKPECARNAVFCDVRIAFLQQEDQGGLRQKRVLQCRYEAVDHAVVIHQKTADREGTLLSSDEIDQAIHVP
jgi:hypothetical protein